MFWKRLGNLYGNFIKNIGSKAPGNYSASFWSNKFSVLLCDGPKLQNSMISGFSNPKGRLFLDFNIPKNFKEYKKYGNIFKYNIFQKILNL